MATNVPYYDLYCEEVYKNEKLTNKLKYAERLYHSEKTRANNLEKSFEDRINKHDNEIINNLEIENEKLKKEIQRLKALLNKDGTNSGLPTSKTPIGKKKVIPNSRQKTGKKKGAQLKHKKHSLEKFNDDEVTEVVEHKSEECPKCHEKMVPTGKIITKDELDIQIIVRKIRHYFVEMKCPKCGYKYIEKIPNDLKEANQYGKHVQALALTLTNEGFVSMKRTKEIISGLTQGQICMSEGYVAKLQKRLANAVKPFIEELKLEVIKLAVLHWDDTTISIGGNMAYMRFYGNKRFALYFAHIKKDKAGIDEDGILQSLDKDTIVVHDHNKVNYNDDYEFQNAECCTHLLRDLKSDTDNLNNDWTKELIDLLVKANKERGEGFTIEEIKKISQKYDEIVDKGWNQNKIKIEEKAYYAEKEATLLRRLNEYKENYLMWTSNVDVPFSNNEAERSLRMSKTKMKVSGQYENIKRAQDAADIRSYIETGKRNGYGVVELIVAALEGHCIMVKEMKKHKDES